MEIRIFLKYYFLILYLKQNWNKRKQNLPLGHKS